MLMYTPPSVIYEPTEKGYRKIIIPATRIGLALEPPDEKGDTDGSGAG